MWDFPAGFRQAKTYPDGVAFKKRHGLSFNPLNTGQDIVVPVSSWLLAGGFPDRPSGEDYHFGRLVESLDGDVGVTDKYTVYPLIRLSGRTGLGGYGGRVAKIAAAAAEYIEGKNPRLPVPDAQRQKTLFSSLSRAARQGRLTGENVLELMELCGCDCRGLPVKVLARLAEIMNEEGQKPEQSRNYARMENYVADFLGDRLPKKDAAGL